MSDYTDEELEAMKAMQSSNSEMAKLAEEPIEQRLLRAYVNGFRDGAQRASWGRWDHS